ncbi:hypothetical protein AHAS_Ahas11G0170200 [Arachis hypogaea]
MKLVYNKLAPIFLCVLGWMECVCPCLLIIYSIPPLQFHNFYSFLQVSTIEKSSIYSHGRKTTIKEFYCVILPSLMQLPGDLVDADITQERVPNGKHQ